MDLLKKVKESVTTEPTEGVMASAIGIPPPYCALKTVAGSNKGASSVGQQI